MNHCYELLYFSFCLFTHVAWLYCIVTFVVYCFKSTLAHNGLKENTSLNPCVSHKRPCSPTKRALPTKMQMFSQFSSLICQTYNWRQMRLTLKSPASSVIIKKSFLMSKHFVLSCFLILHLTVNTMRVIHKLHTTVSSFLLTAFFATPQVSLTLSTSRQFLIGAKVAVSLQ